MSKKRKQYYAVDFDGTICENAYPKIGKLKEATANIMRTLKKNEDNRIILWTCRSGKGLEEAEKFLKDNDVPYDYVNKNPEFDTGSPKIYADKYIDDKAVDVKDIDKIASYKYQIEKLAMGRKKKSPEEKFKSAIVKAGKGNNLLKLWYTDKKGNPSVRLVEPYEIRGGDFFGHDIKKDQIRRFKINTIEDIKISKKKFEPRWPIKVAEFKQAILEKVAVLNYSIQNSDIAGKGTFAKTDISKDSHIGVAFIRKQNTMNPDVDFKRTLIGAYTNHSENPNMEIQKNNNVYTFISKRPIKKDEELTVNYANFDWDGERDFVKMAALKESIKLYPHQQKIVDEHSTSKILAHPTGSGKTLTGIAKFEKMRERGQAHKALVVVPAGLRSNFAIDGVAKFTDSKYNIIGNKAEIGGKSDYGEVDSEADYNIISYDIFKKNPEKYIRESGADTVITDESHRGKNEDTAVTESLKNSRKLYPNYIGMTGSVVSNSLSDVQPLIDIASGGMHYLGASKKEFEDRYIQRDNSKKYRDVSEKRRPVTGFKNQGLLKSGLSQYIDYVDAKDIQELAKMPEKDLHLIKVPISAEQAKLYKGIMKNNPSINKMIQTKRLETLKDEEAAKAFSKLIEARKLMNSVGAVKPGLSLEKSLERTPKTRKVIDDLNDYMTKNPKGRALLFSHLINGGSDILEAGLKQKGISYGKFIGKGNKGVTEDTRQQDVADYNSGKKRVMIISSAGGEGLSLNDTNYEAVLDPHYNPEKMKQMEARGIRSGGLSSLPKEQRKVRVNRYMATMPREFFGLFKSKYKTPDEFMYEIARNKENQNQKMHDLLKQK